MPSSLSNFLWKHVFTAFLPPTNADDVDYYTVLGLTPNSGPAPATEDVRKAYRKLSLELHPDKIAQRGGGSYEQEEARVKYEAVQQAYGVLVDPKTRSLYDDWRPSPTRYQFVANSQWFHPVSLFENLTQASLSDKSKLIVLVAVFLLALLVQPILIAVKVNQDGRLDEAPWLLLLIPLWVLGALVILFWTILAVGAKSAVAGLVAMEYTAWLTGCVLLACLWDDLLAINWFFAAIPFYTGVLFRILQSIMSLRTARNEQEKMISPDYYRRLLQAYRDLAHQRESADEEQGARGAMGAKESELLEDHPTEESYIDFLQKEYIVVTLNDEAYAAAVALMGLPDETGRIHVVTDDEKETLQITMSVEYMAMEEAIEEQKKSVYALVAVGISFVTLVAWKLETSSTASWWTIFTPFWVYFGAKLLNVCFVCCCASVSGEPVVLHSPGQDDWSEHVDEATKGDKGLEPTASVSFAAADGEMGDFNAKQPIAKDEQGAPTVIDAQTTQASSADTELGSSADVEPMAVDIGRDIDTTKSAEPMKGIQLAEGAEQSGNGMKQERTSDHFGATDNTPNDPEIDFEAAYFAWQNAHAQAEQNAVEQQTKAAGTCCYSVLQLMIVCLIVGKLEAATDGDGDGGFNALWVLFPVFFLTGIIMCCCSCFIYRAGPDSLNIVTERAKKDEQNATGMHHEPARPTPMNGAERSKDDDEPLSHVNDGAERNDITESDQPVPATHVTSTDEATMDDLD